MLKLSRTKNKWTDELHFLPSELATAQEMAKLYRDQGYKVTLTRTSFALNRPKNMKVRIESVSDKKKPRKSRKVA